MKQKIEFTKMHGLGNDYIYVNCLEREVENAAAVSELLSDRHAGVGADGLVLIKPSDSQDYRMQMFNADGSEAEMCGNAVRCVAKYLYDRGITDKELIKLETKAGLIVLELAVSDGAVQRVRVDMGEPILNGPDIPVAIDANPVLEQSISIDGEELSMTCVSMGNPHAVFFVPEITDRHILDLGPKIEHHKVFPNRINAEFVTVQGRNEVTMRVWERGSGETMACGTGAAAVGVACVLNEKTDRTLTVHLRGGDLEIEWAENNHVYKTGPASFVFDSVIEVDV